MFPPLPPFRILTRRPLSISFDVPPNGGGISDRNAVREDGSVLPYRLQIDKPGILTNLSLNETTRRKKFMDSYSTVKSFEVPAAGRYELTADPRAAGVTEFEFRVIKAEP